MTTLHCAGTVALMLIATRSCMSSESPYNLMIKVQPKQQGPEIPGAHDRAGHGC